MTSFQNDVSPFATTVRFKKGRVGIDTGVSVKSFGGSEEFNINESSVHPGPGTEGIGVRVINHVTTVLIGATSGNIEIDFRYGNNFEISEIVNGPCTFVNPVPESVIAGQQGSIELRVEENSNATFAWGNAFYFPGGTPPTIGAGTTILLGYYIFESPSAGAPNGKIMISGIEDLRPAS